ncbi:hypothetical protein NP493_800g01029 [Ridgeia piscesae]|uniref:Secreted protein n=1 Tax=Ridgeia piscesae TaxID=27915 RepID=A0AAD9KN85_RIDPI|nr:hypothetical protein NP493_800g01029 [Ridgeia piscesae]
MKQAGVCLVVVAMATAYTDCHFLRVIGTGGRSYFGRCAVMRARSRAHAYRYADARMPNDTDCQVINTPIHRRPKKNAYLISAGVRWRARTYQTVIRFHQTF